MGVLGCGSRGILDACIRAKGIWEMLCDVASRHGLE
jgi:hypothetical protein